MLVNVYLDMNPLTNKPFYVGIGGEKRCKLKSRDNIYHKKLVGSFPDRKFKRIILYKDIELEKAYKLEIQIIKKCGRLYNNSGYLANIHSGGYIPFSEKTNFTHMNKDFEDVIPKHHALGKPFLYMYDKETKLKIIEDSNIKRRETIKNRLQTFGRSDKEKQATIDRVDRIKMGNFTENELKAHEKASKFMSGKTMKEVTNNPDWVCWRKGKTHKELFGDDYISPRTGNKNKDYNPNFFNPMSKPFKIVINESNIIYFSSEEEFTEKTKLHNRVLSKLKKDKKYYIKRRQHNTTHNYKVGDTFKYFDLTIEEYKKLTNIV